MAVDTQEKRMAVLGMCIPWMGAHPSGTVDEEERVSIAFAYGGNALSPPVGGTILPQMMQHAS